MNRFVSASLILALAAPTLVAQETQGRDFRWEGAVASGKWVKVQNINGDVGKPGRDHRDQAQPARRYRQRQNRSQALRHERGERVRLRDLGRRDLRRERL